MYFAFDAETDGLYGEAFAIAAVVIDNAGHIEDSFSGTASLEDVADAWTLENCVPHLSGIPKYPDRKALREAFWLFYLKYREACDIVADVPYPVESQLMRQCVEEHSGSTFLGPYPLIDVASVFYAKGMDPQTDRIAFSGQQGQPHNPMTDAIASAKCLIRLME